MPPTEVPQPPVWRKDAQQYAALPCCRNCAEKHKLDQLVAYPSQIQCGVAKCENTTAYLHIR